jgi:hypothetical protein
VLLMLLPAAHAPQHGLELGRVLHLVLVRVAQLRQVEGRGRCYIGSGGVDGRVGRGGCVLGGGSFGPGGVTVGVRGCCHNRVLFGSIGELVLLLLLLGRLRRRRRRRRRAPPTPPRRKRPPRLLLLLLLLRRLPTTRRSRRAPPSLLLVAVPTTGPRHEARQHQLI